MKHKIKDGFNFLSKITFKRAFNALQILVSYIYSKSTKTNSILGTPISISFEPTTSCNLRCPECPSGLRSFTRPTGMLEANLFKKIIDEISERLLYLIFYFQGEPYLHPKFFELVKYASSKKIYTATSTNAHYLSETNARQTIQSGLDRLIISIDGTTQDVYEQYRIGGNLSKVFEGIENINKAKKELKSATPHIILQFLVVKPNEHQIDDFKAIAKKYNVDFGLKTAQIYDFENGNSLIPTKNQYSRYEEVGVGKFKIKNKLIDHCWKMWHSCVITWDGAIVPCCFDKDAEYKVGDLKENSFKSQWFGTQYQGFRSTLMESRSKIEMCKNCTEGTKIWG